MLRSGTPVAVCVPQGRSTEPTSSGLVLSLMSKMCSPSKPAGTGSPPHVVVPEAGASQVRTTMFLKTTTSPWGPLQNARPTCVGLSGFLMFRMLKPSQFPWIANLPQKAMSVWMSGFPIAGLRRLAGSKM